MYHVTKQEEAVLNVSQDSMVEFVRKTVVLVVAIYIVIKLRDIVTVKMDIMGMHVTNYVLIIVNHVEK